MRFVGGVCRCRGRRIFPRITKKTKITKIRYSSESSRGCGFCGNLKNTCLSKLFYQTYRFFVCINHGNPSDDSRENTNRIFFIFFSAKNLSLWIIFNVKNVYNFDFIKLLYVDNGGKIFLFFCEYEHTENLKYLAHQ